MMIKDGESFTSTSCFFLSLGAFVGISNFDENGNVIYEEKPNVGLAVTHLALAASMNHVRSLSYLSHALYDPESWLGQYEREEKLRKYNEEKNLRKYFYENENKMDCSRDEGIFYDCIRNYIRENDSHRSKSYHSRNSSTSWSRWTYNESEPIYLALPSGLLKLPQPLGPSCEVALPILKHISEMVRIMIHELYSL
jgi:hypothetical protein